MSKQGMGEQVQSWVLPSCYLAIERYIKYSKSNAHLKEVQSKEHTCIPPSHLVCYGLQCLQS